LLRYMTLGKAAKGVLKYIAINNAKMSEPKLLAAFCFASFLFHCIIIVIVLKKKEVKFAAISYKYHRNPVLYILMFCFLVFITLIFLFLSIDILFRTRLVETLLR
jgi:TctA family transporter